MPPEISTRARPSIRATACRTSASRQIVEHDDVRVGLQRIVDVGETLRLDLNRQPGTPGPGAADRFDDAAGDANVIVLDENAVVQTGAVVDAAAAAHGVLRQRAHCRHALARVEHDDAAAGRLDEPLRHRRDA